MMPAAPGQDAFEAGAHGHEASLRAAVEERHPEALHGSDGDVSSELAGGSQQGQRQQVRRDDDLGSALVGLGDGRGQRPDLAGAPRVRRHQAEELALGERPVKVDDDHLDVIGHLRENAVKRFADEASAIERRYADGQTVGAQRLNSLKAVNSASEGCAAAVGSKT